MVGRVALVVLSTCLAAPAVAEAAGTLSRDGNTVVFTEPAGSTVVNNVHVFFFDGAHWIRDDSGGPITDAGSGCTVVVATFRCTGVDAFRVVTSGGNDTVDGRATETGTEPSKLPLVADLGAGADSFSGGSVGDTALGGEGDDSSLEGLDGDDVIDGGPGKDLLEGDAGADTVTYAARAEAVTVDLTKLGFDQGSDVDGPPGDRDLIDPDFEVIVGGSGADVMTAGGYPITFRGGPGGDQLSGSAGVETLDGGDGEDLLNALDGPDTVLGGRGVDTVEARDGDVDTVDCGPEVDNAAADSFDAVTSCEPTEPTEPAGPTPVPETIVLPSRVLFDLAYTFSANRRGAVLRNLAAQVERGARLRASCRTRRGRRCPRTRDLTRASAAVAVRLRAFEGRRLPVGARLTIRVTKPGTIGAVKTLTIRRRRAPSVRTLCLPPGASRPAAC